MSHAAVADFHVSARPSGLPVVHELDDLLDLEADDLSRLYVAARVPRLGTVSGDLRGRMLAIPSFGQSLVASACRGLARTSSFPWKGKTFTPLTESAGEGINRVFSDRFRLFRFTTFVGPSRAGDFDAVQLDYDHPENPFFIRAIKDEIRELSPGLWLGQAYLNVGRAPVLGLYFGLAEKR